jgi:hypothetical protein
MPLNVPKINHPTARIATLDATQRKMFQFSSKFDARQRAASLPLADFQPQVIQRDKLMVLCSRERIPPLEGSRGFSPPYIYIDGIGFNAASIPT